MPELPHAARGADATGNGAKKGTFASHRWLAGNTAVPFYYGFDEQLAKTQEFLKSGMYFNVDFFAIRKPKTDEVSRPWVRCRSPSRRTKSSRRW